MAEGNPDPKVRFPFPSIDTAALRMFHANPNFLAQGPQKALLGQMATAARPWPGFGKGSQGPLYWRGMKFLFLVALAALSACDTFASPASLDNAQILAVQSEPASLRLGESASLRLFAADSEGPLENPAVEWALVEQPGLTLVGTLSAGDDSEARYQAPEQVPSLPTAVAVQATIDHEEGPLVALKFLLIGGPALENPSITELTLNGEAVEGPVLLKAGEEVELDVKIDPPASDEITYAWYAHPGEIDAYRSTPTTMVAATEAAAGWLYVVVRDHGGVAYRAVEVQVE